MIPLELKILLLRASGPALGVLALLYSDLLESASAKQEIIILLLLIPAISPVLRFGVSIACFSSHKEDLLLSKQLHLIANFTISFLVLIDVFTSQLISDSFVLALAISSSNSFLFNYSQVKVAEGAWQYYWMQSLPMNILIFAILFVISTGETYTGVATKLAVVLLVFVALISLARLAKERLIDVPISSTSVLSSWLSDVFNSFHTPLLLLGLAFLLNNESGSEVALAKAVLFIETLAVGILLPKIKRGNSIRFLSNRPTYLDITNLDRDDVSVGLLLLASIAVAILGTFLGLSTSNIVALFAICSVYIYAITCYGYIYLLFFKNGSQRFYIYSIIFTQAVFWTFFFLGFRGFSFVEYMFFYLSTFHIASGLTIRHTKKVAENRWSG